MAARRVIFLVAFQWIVIQTSHTKEINIKHRDSDGVFDYLNFAVHHRSRLYLPFNLTNVLQKSQLVHDDTDCMFACLDEPWCHSANLNITPQKDGRQVCEVLSTDKYNSSKHFIPDKDFTHLSIKSPCESSPCGDKGTCIALYNKRDFYCACAAGFTGRKCLIDINECSTSSPCNQYATCNNTKGSYVCQCNAGYTGNGHTCTDVDECTENSHQCDSNARCINTQGSHKCTCNRGYYGSGTTCTLLQHNGLDSSGILSYYDNGNYVKKLYDYLRPVLQNSATSRWTRCWRAPANGWAVSIFHSRCDNKGPTVTIVRVGSYVFGGYTDKSWNTLSSSYTSSSRSFLYTLYNTHGYYPTKLTLTGRHQHAIYRRSDYGPTFGGGHDFHIANYASSNQRSYTNPHTYRNPGFHLAGSHTFTPNDVEVFYETT